MSDDLDSLLRKRLCYEEQHDTKYRIWEESHRGGFPPYVSPPQARGLPGDDEMDRLYPGWRERMRELRESQGAKDA